MAQNQFSDLIPEKNQFADLIPGEPMHSMNDPRGAALTIGSSVIAAPVSGLTGLASMVAGFVGGLAPGGETPLQKGQRFGADAQAATQDFLTIDPPNEASADLLRKAGRAFDTPLAAAGSFGLDEEMTANREESAATRERQEERFQAILDKGVDQASGDAVFEATGSPFLAALTQVVPAAVESAAGMLGLRATKTAARTATRPTVTQGTPTVSVGQPRLDAPVDFTPAETIVSNLRRGKSQQVADAVVPDVATIESAQRLGIDLNPEHYSNNAAFQDITRALKQQPGSALQANEVAALAAVGRQADDLVVRSQGFIDKAEFNNEIATEFSTTIDDLSTQARSGYDAVNQAIPAATRIESPLIREYMDVKLAELGGDVKLLTPVERKLLALTRVTKDGKTIPPTYAALDRVRKDVGNGFRRQGPFADTDSAILSEVYGVLSDVQSGAARSFGVGDLYDSARGLVTRRKALEDVAVQLFGRNMSGSLVPKITGAATGLVKGDVSKFNQLINALPEARRGEAAATVLNDIFSGGSRRGGELGTGFVASWAALNRNQAAKNALFQHLPPGARQRFDDIGRVLTGIVSSNRKPLGNPSGTAAGIIKALDDFSFGERLYEGGRKVAAAEGVSTTVGAPGIGSAVVIGSLLNKKRTPISVAADQMIASPAFARSINTAIEGDVVAANRIIENSPAFKRWLQASGPEAQSQIAATGFIAWLAAEDE